MNVDRKQNFRTKFLPQNDFHIVRLTAVDILLSSCFASKAETVPTSKKAHTEYVGAFIFDGDKTGTGYTFTAGPTIWNSF